MTTTDPFVVVRLTTALPVPRMAVVWFVSWTVPNPEEDTVPFVVFGVILQEAVTGNVRLTFPFVEVTT